MPTVLIVDDERDITSFLGAFFERSGHQVLKAYTGEDAVSLVKKRRPDLVLLDLRLPDITGFEVLERVKEERPVVIMITGHGDVSLAVRAMQAGAESFLTKPIDLAHLGAAAERAFEKAHLRQMNLYLTERRGEMPARAMLGSSPPMRELAGQIDLLARSDRTTVLLVGEVGTGKGRVAEAMHRQSPRAGQRFVEVNCAALTAASLDSELFGVEQAGAPEGEEYRPGLLEVANNGTLFLDEIGDLDAHLQPKLLRVLEGKSFRRQGGTREVQSDVRLIAATSRDLVAEVTAGRFREDLYYRLSVMPDQPAAAPCAGARRSRGVDRAPARRSAGESARGAGGAGRRRARTRAQVFVARQHPRDAQRPRARDDRRPRRTGDRRFPSGGRSARRVGRGRGAPRAAYAVGGGTAAHRPHTACARREPYAGGEGTRHLPRDVDQEDQGVRGRVAPDGAVRRSAMTNELHEHDAMTCRSCGNEERASEGYPCVDCGTFICVVCNLRGVTRCRDCQAKHDAGHPSAAS